MKLCQQGNNSQANQSADRNFFFLFSLIRLFDKHLNAAVIEAPAQWGLQIKTQWHHERPVLLLNKSSYLNLFLIKVRKVFLQWRNSAGLKKQKAYLNQSLSLLEIILLTVRYITASVWVIYFIKQIFDFVSMQRQTSEQVFLTIMLHNRRHKSSIFSRITKIFLYDIECISVYKSLLR